MPDIITFDEAIERTKEEDRSLLLGNGFSADYFSYSSLLEHSGLKFNTPPGNLFSLFETSNFEEIVRILEETSKIAASYAENDFAKETEEHAEILRKKLIGSIHATHPEHRDEIQKYPSADKFLSNFLLFLR